MLGRLSLGVLILVVIGQLVVGCSIGGAEFSKARSYSFEKSASPGIGAAFVNLKSASVAVDSNTTVLSFGLVDLPDMRLFEPSFLDGRMASLIFECDFDLNGDGLQDFSIIRDIDQNLSGEGSASQSGVWLGSLLPDGDYLFFQTKVEDARVSSSVLGKTLQISFPTSWAPQLLNLKQSSVLRFTSRYYLDGQVESDTLAAR